MILLPESITCAAADLLAQGFRPLDPVGRVAPPLGTQTSAAQWVADWTWQAMVLMTMAAEPSSLR